MLVLYKEESINYIVYSLLRNEKCSNSIWCVKYTAVKNEHCVEAVTWCESALTCDAGFIIVKL